MFEERTNNADTYKNMFEFSERHKFSYLVITASLVEIYSVHLSVLLKNHNPVKCLEDPCGKSCFPSLSEHVEHTVEELMKHIQLELSVIQLEPL